MPRTFPWRSTTSAVYHNNSACKAGNAVLPGERREGSGGRALCPECAELNEKERAAALPRRNRESRRG